MMTSRLPVCMVNFQILYCVEKLILNSMHSFYTICVNYPANATLVCISLDIKSAVCLSDGAINSCRTMVHIGPGHKASPFGGAIFKGLQNPTFRAYILPI